MLDFPGFGCSRAFAYQTDINNNPKASGGSWNSLMYRQLENRSSIYLSMEQTGSQFDSYTHRNVPIWLKKLSRSSL
jgi:hypothetical protein